MPPVGIKSSRRIVRNIKKGGSAVKNHYLVMQRGIGGRCYAYVMLVGASSDLTAISFIQKYITKFHICDSKEEADALAARWNEEYRRNGILYCHH